jgi:hypothetical protein
MSLPDSDKSLPESRMSFPESGMLILESGKSYVASGRLCWRPAGRMAGFSFLTTRAYGRTWVSSPEGELFALRRCPPKVAVPDPRRLRSHVHQTRPSLAVATIGERGEVDLLQAFQLFALWEVRGQLRSWRRFLSPIALIIRRSPPGRKLPLLARSPTSNRRVCLVVQICPRSDV